MTFRERSAAACVAITAVTFGAYGLWAIQAPRSTGQAVAALVAVIAAQIVLQIAAHILFAVIGPREPADERDRAVQHAAQRNAYWVLFTALWIVLGLAILEAPNVAMVYGLVAVIVIAELVRYGSQLVYYRRGV